MISFSNIYKMHWSQKFHKLISSTTKTQIITIWQSGTLFLATYVYRIIISIVIINKMELLYSKKYGN